MRGFLKNVLIADAIILGMALLAWGVGEEYTMDRFVEILSWTAMIAIVIGCLVLFGSRKGTQNPVYKASVGQSMDHGERTREGIRWINSGFASALVLTAAGVVAIGLCELLSA